MELKRIIRFFGKRESRTHNSAFEALFGISPESLASTELSSEIVTEGDSMHDHEFQNVKWDSERLGPCFGDVDEVEDSKPGIAFPFATFKDFYRCSCGREVVRSIRSLF